MPLDLAGHQIAHDDAARFAVDDHQIQHLTPWEQGHPAEIDLPQKRAVRAQQQLLTGLTAGIKRARNLRATERPVRQQAAVFARKRHALRHRLIDDVHAQLRQPVHIGFTRAVIAALDGVVKQPPDAIAIVLIILRRIDATLRGNAVRAPRRILDAKTLDIVSQFGQSGAGRGARKPGAHHDDGVLAFVGRIDQFQIRLMAIPFFMQRARGEFRIEFHYIAPL